MRFYYDFTYRRKSYLIEFNQDSKQIAFKLYELDNYNGRYIYSSIKKLAGMPLTINPVIRDCKRFLKKIMINVEGK